MQSWFSELSKTEPLYNSLYIQFDFLLKDDCIFIVADIHEW